MAFTLLQGGEFGFVLFSLALNKGLLSSEVSSILNASIILSMALTPFLFSINQKRLRTNQELCERPFDEINSEGVEVIVAGYGRFGQIVCKFLNSQKVNFLVLENSPSQFDAARKYNQKIFYGDASRRGILDSAGVKEAKYFVLAINDLDKSIEIAKPVKTNFPDIKILVRARNRKHVFELLKIGIEANF